MDYTVHGVAKTWTRLSNFHFFLSFNLILRLWLAVVPHAVVGLQTRVCPAVISGHALKSSARAQLCLTLCDSMDCNLTGSSIHGILQGRIRSFRQRIFLTQGSNLDLPHCKQTLYRLSHQGSPPLHTRCSLNYNSS